MSKDLRSKLIRLAHQKPELRKDLLPLLKMSFEGDTLSRTIETEGKKWGVKLTHKYNDDEAGYVEYSFGSKPQKKQGIMIAEAFQINAWYEKGVFDVLHNGEEVASFNSNKALYRGIYDVLLVIFDT